MLVARSIFTVGAKRCRCMEVMIRTQISIQLRILTAPRRNHHHSSRQTLLLVPNASVTQKYCSSQITVQHEVCRLHPQRAVHHVVLSPSTTVFQLIQVVSHPVTFLLKFGFSLSRQSSWSSPLTFELAEMTTICSSQLNVDNMSRNFLYSSSQLRQSCRLLL